MADIDRISSLPNEILCHILSFLPTKVSVLTSVLSKRWNPLWISVPTFHFGIHDDNYFCDNNKDAYSLFIQSVYSFLLWRDFEKPLQTFRLRYCTIFYDYSNIKTWLHFATTQGRVQHLDLYFDGFIHLPSFVLGCKTLVVLKLKNLLLKDLSSVDLPNIKVLHLNSVVLADGVAVAHLLSCCPNLEDLELKSLVFRTIGKFQRLPKLVRANIHTHIVPLEVLNNVQFLSMSSIEDKDVLPEFPNLTHIEIGYLVFTKDWIEVLKVLQNSPILQILVIEKHNAKIPIKEESEVWPYPESVPLCILSHLRTCCLKNFGEGFKGEFQFARYILQNARHLRRMRICFDDEASQEERVKIINQLSLCARRSETCTLSFA